MDFLRRLGAAASDGSCVEGRHPTMLSRSRGAPLLGCAALARPPPAARAPASVV